jgi:hypothetical protein
MLIPIFQFTFRDSATGEDLVHQRLGTKEAISKVGGVMLGGTRVLIDATQLCADGMTGVGYRPPDMPQLVKSEMDRPARKPRN